MIEVKLNKAGVLWWKNADVGDFDGAGFRLTEREFPVPSKIRSTVQLPYRDGEIDFSYLAGQEFYDKREFSLTFSRVCENLKDMQTAIHSFGRNVQKIGQFEYRDWVLQDFIANVSIKNPICTNLEFEESASGFFVVANCDFEVCDPWFYDFSDFTKKVGIA